MGGKSSQTQTQSSTTAPWDKAQPALTGLLDNLQGQIGNAGLSGKATGAIDQLQANAQGGNPYAGMLDSVTKNMLAGGGANDQAGAIGQNLTDFHGRMSPYADPNYSSLNNPQLQAALQTIRDDVGNSINGQFAAAGRDLSGANQGAWARGVTSAQAPLILDQFNKDRALQQGAASSLYDAGTGTSGLLAGLNQQGNVNAQAGAGMTGQALEAANYSPKMMLELEQLRKSLPAEHLGLLAQIGVPIAGLGSQTSGTGTATNQMSGVQQFQGIMSGIGSLGNLWNKK